VLYSAIYLYYIGGGGGGGGGGTLAVDAVI